MPEDFKGNSEFDKRSRLKEQLIQPDHVPFKYRRNPLFGLQYSIQTKLDDNSQNILMGSTENLLAAEEPKKEMRLNSRLGS